MAGSLLVSLAVLVSDVVVSEFWSANLTDNAKVVAH